MTHPDTILEPIRVHRDGVDTGALAAGTPGMPRRFHWRNQTYDVVEVGQAGKTTGPCRNGSAERYVRRHWAVVRVNSGDVMRLTAERGGRRGSSRWWITHRWPAGTNESLRGLEATR